MTLVGMTESSAAFIILPKDLEKYLSEASNEVIKETFEVRIILMICILIKIKIIRSLLLLVEPVFSPIWAWLLLAESPGTLAILGGRVVILATGIHSFQQGLRKGGLK